MPYKDIEKRKLDIIKWKLAHKKEIAQKAAELYRSKHPVKERVLLSEEYKRRMKAKHDRTYRLLHANKIKKKKRIYYQTNKKLILNKYLTDLKQNINKKLAHNLRSRLNSAVKRGAKAGSAVRDLGCSIETFKIHISELFKSNMSWENYGIIWHLDHIIPLCRFNLSNREEFLRAARYSNYQPLFVKDNLVKNKYDDCR